MATVKVELQNEDKSESDKRTICRYRRLYDMFLFVSILLLFINYFTVQRELEELRKNTLILRPKGQKGLFNSQGELEEPGPREYLGSGGGPTVIEVVTGSAPGDATNVDEGDIGKIGQVEDKFPTTGQIVHEGDEREPDGPDVKTSSPLNPTDQACDPGWTYFAHTRNCYKSDESKLTRSEASQACKAANPTAHLVSIFDKTTNDFIFSMIKIRSWIGLNKVSNEWRWADGTKASYTNWIQDPPQPSGDGPYVEMFKTWKFAPGQWNDIDEDHKAAGYVCQYAPIGVPVKYVSVTKDNLVGTIPRWGEYFRVSLQVWIDSFKGPYNRYGYSELLRFTSTVEDCCSPGDRIPAIFVHHHTGSLHITSTVGTNGNFNRNAKVQPKTWTKIEIKQFPENGKVMFQILVNGNTIIKIQNTRPVKYKNVKVWAARGTPYPAAVNARVKDLEYGRDMEDDRHGDSSVAVTTSSPLNLADQGDTADSRRGDSSLAVTTSSPLNLADQGDTEDDRHGDTSLAVTTSSPLNLADQDCDPGWKLFKNSNTSTSKCYRYVTLETDWYEAVKVCESASKHPSSMLASVPDQATNEFLYELVASVNYQWTWTGGHQDSNDEWIWLDGSKIYWFNWFKGEPNDAGTNEDYLVFNYGGGFWSDDTPTKFQRPSLCQYDP